MSKNFDYSLKDISSNLEKSLKEAELLGEGHNGVVFLLKNNRAIKIFRRMSVWKDESLDFFQGYMKLSQDILYGNMLMGLD